MTARPQLALAASWSRGLAAVLAVLLIGACSGVRSTLVDRAAGSAQFYPLDRATADRILRTALADEFPDLAVSPLPDPLMGYAVVDDHVFEMNRYSVVMVPVSNPGLEGDGAAGFAFETRFRGTLSYEGEVSIKRLFRRLLALAETKARPVPMAPTKSGSRLALVGLNPTPLFELKKSRKIDPHTGLVR